MNLLHPFQINHWDNADFQIDLLGDIDVARDDGSVKPLVKEQIGPFREGLPFRKRSGCRTKTLRFRGVVNVMSGVTLAVLSIVSEHGFQVLKEVGLGPEMAEMMVTLRSLLGNHPAHFLTVIAMEGVAFDIHGLDLLASEDLFERVPDGSGAGTRRPGRGDNRMPSGHGHTLRLAPDQTTTKEERGVLGRELRTGVGARDALDRCA